MTLSIVGEDRGDVGWKPSESRSLAKWLGSLGQFGQAPDYYFIAEAAKELGMGYRELEQDQARERWMSHAFTLLQGRHKGEHLVQLNPVFIEMQKKRQDELEKAQKRRGR